MASYYYLISSLPELRADGEMPISYSEFLTYCQSNVSETTYQLLKDLTLNSSEGPLVDKWANFYGMLMKELNFPVFSAAINVVGTTKAFPGKINHPVVMCGVTVYPGDLIFADNDDVVVVPRERAEEVYEITLAREKKEEILLQRIKNHEGTTYDLSGFNKIVESLSLTEEPD